MASIVMADSMDSYAALSELASSGRYTYIPVSNTYTTWQLAVGGGRYGGNAIRALMTSVNGAYQYTQGYGYVSGNMMPITIPGYMTGSWVTNPFYNKALQMSFWFKSVNTNSGAVSKVAIVGFSAGGSSATVLYNGSGLSITDFLMYTPPASVTAQGTLTLNQLASGNPLISATCPVNIGDGNWHWIELCIVPNNTSVAGSPASITPGAPPFWSRVYVDQQMVLNQTTSGLTVSTNATQYPQYASFYMLPNGYIGLSQNPATNDGNYFDDIIVGVSTGAPSFPFGPRRMACLRPNADGDVIGYAPVGSSDNYSAINKGYSNTTSYVQSTNFNVEDRYKFPALSYVPQNVNAVIANVQAGNFEPGTAIGMSPTLYDGTADVAGARVTLPQFKYSPFQTIYETDNEGNNWTPSEVNSIQVGFKSIA